MITLTKLSCEEIYSRIVRSKDKETGQTVYFYYLVPFKEKVFFYPPKGFSEAMDKGEVNEVTLKPDFTNKQKCILVSFRTYSGVIENSFNRRNILRS